MKVDLTAEFLAGIKAIENILIDLHFYPYSFEQRDLLISLNIKREIL